MNRPVREILDFELAIWWLSLYCKTIWSYLFGNYVCTKCRRVGIDLSHDDLDLQFVETLYGEDWRLNTIEVGEIWACPRCHKLYELGNWEGFKEVM